VEAGSGIQPDTVVAENDPGPFIAELNRKALLFLYANRYVRTRQDTSAADVVISAQVLQDFRDFLRERGFDYREPAEILLSDLKERAREARYAQTFLEQLGNLELRAAEEKERALERYEPELRRALRDELTGRLQGEKARIARALPDDPQVQVAVRLLSDRGLYQQLLEGKR
jgi:carboxyl-terminal processing protease